MNLTYTLRSGLLFHTVKALNAYFWHKYRISKKQSISHLKRGCPTYYLHTYFQNETIKFPKFNFKNLILKFLYLNARSANNKLDVLRSLAQDVHQAKILLITETWFNKASKMKIDNFNLVTHKNRTLNKASGAGVGGGVAIYVHQSIAHDCFEIKTKCKSRLQQTVAASICGQVFVLTYRSPSTESMKGNRKRDVLQTMQNDWYELKPGSANPIWIGDFNCPTKSPFLPKPFSQDSHLNDLSFL